MKAYAMILLFLLLATACSVQENPPIEIRVGEEINKAATEFSQYSPSPQIVTENTIVITSLSNGVTITQVRVNKGNIPYANRLQPLPVRLNYGEEYRLVDDTEQTILDKVRKDAAQNGMRIEDANNAAVMALMQQAGKKYRIMEIEVTLSDGKTWTFTL